MDYHAYNHSIINPMTGECYGPCAHCGEYKGSQIHDEFKRKCKNCKQPRHDHTAVVDSDGDKVLICATAVWEW